MRYAEVFAGIRGASVAWEPLGWECAWVAETEPFASAVGAYHFGAPNLGDVREINRQTASAIDVLVGGPPCQDFSVAGRRAGMDGERGSMVWEYLRVADELRPRWLVFENVPGLLSSNGGRDFGTLLGAMAERGYMGCYRILDAQFAGVPQRRRRVFIVGYLGDWRPAAAVLLERESLSGNPPPSREEGKGVARPIASRTGNCSQDESKETFVTTGARDAGMGYWREGEFSLRAQPGGIPENVVAFSCKDRGGDVGEVSPPLRAMNHDGSHPNAGGQVAVVDAKQVQWASGGGQVENDTAQSLRSGAEHSYQFARIGAAVRRLLPTECEALQGFPRNYTQIPWRGKPREQCPDGPRYRVLGNAFPVPVVRWIGERIAMVEVVRRKRLAAQAAERE